MTIFFRLILFSSALTTCLVNCAPTVSTTATVSIVEDTPNISIRQRKLNSVKVRIRNLRKHSHEKSISTLETMEADRIISEIKDLLKGKPTDILLTKLELAAVLYELGIIKYRLAECQDDNDERKVELKKLKKIISDLENY